MHHPSTIDTAIFQGQSYTDLLGSQLFWYAIDASDKRELAGPKQRLSALANLKKASYDTLKACHFKQGPCSNRHMYSPPVFRA